MTTAIGAAETPTLAALALKLHWHGLGTERLPGDFSAIHGFFAPPWVKQTSGPWLRGVQRPAAHELATAVFYSQVVLFGFRVALCPFRVQPSALFWG